MFCHNCGAQLDNNAKFCHKCGAKLSETNANPQQIGGAELSGVPVNLDKGVPKSEKNAPFVSASGTPQPASPQNVPNAKKRSTVLLVLGWVIYLTLAIILFFAKFTAPVAIGVSVGMVSAGTVLEYLGAEKPLSKKSKRDLAGGIVIITTLVVVAIIYNGISNKYVNMVKNGYLDGFPKMTVGKAFDGFMNNPKWESYKGEDYRRYVNVEGEITYLGEDAKAAVQFLIPDENKEEFEFKALEIDGEPQNNLVALGLFAAMYGDAESLNTDDNSESVLDKITVNKTQTYDNNYSDLEVTLDDVVFTDKIVNTLLGDYTYPSEDSVFFIANLTVKNIGKLEGQLVTSWNTIVYDGEYEFRHYSTEGNTLGIAPLSAPEKISLIFEVPTEVMTSDKSLTLDLNSFTDTVLSFDIRGTSNQNYSNTTNAGTTAPSSESSGALDVNGNPATDDYYIYFQSDNGNILGIQHRSNESEIGVMIGGYEGVFENQLTEQYNNEQLTMYYAGILGGYYVSITADGDTDYITFRAEDGPLEMYNANYYPTGVDGTTPPTPTVTVKPIGSFDENGFIFPDSDIRYLTDEELSQLTLDQLGFARNEIFARYGNNFKTDKYKNHYSQYDWYNNLPKIDNVGFDMMLNIDIENVEFIEKWESARKNNTVPSWYSPRVSHNAGELLW